MKKFREKIIPILTASAWMLSGIAVIVLLGAAVEQQNRHTVQGIRVEVDEVDGLFFVDREAVLTLLSNHQLNPEKLTTVQEVGFATLEAAVERHDFVKEAEVFVDGNNLLTIQVKQRVPVLRIINNQGVSYYLDEYGKRMPLSNKFTARVPVATGFIFTNADRLTQADSLTELKLFTLVRFMQSDSFLSPLIEQVIVNQQQEFELIPRIGNHAILVGDATQLEAKFDRLQTFYRQSVHHIDWSRYSQLNLKYDGLVYGVRRDGGNLESVPAFPETNQVTH